MTFYIENIVFFCKELSKGYQFTFGFLFHLIPTTNKSKPMNSRYLC